MPSHRGLIAAGLFCCLVATSSVLASKHARSKLNILPLGDSITDADGQHDSYRRHLWHLLWELGFEVDFVGSRRFNGYNDEHALNSDFDTDHEGHSGWTARDIVSGPTGWGEQRGYLDLWVSSFKPDVVLLHIGTNDIFHCERVQDILAQVEKIVDTIQSQVPNSIVIVARIIPIGDAQSLGFDDRYCGEKSLAEFIIELNEAVDAKLTKRAGVIVADIHGAIDATTDLYDGIHPNPDGERKIAEAWFTALEPVLLRTRRAAEEVR